jgi:hypothetical protein
MFTTKVWKGENEDVAIEESSRVDKTVCLGARPDYTNSSNHGAANGGYQVPLIFVDLIVSGVGGPRQRLDQVLQHTSTVDPINPDGASSNPVEGHQDPTQIRERVTDSDSDSVRIIGQIVRILSNRFPSVRTDTITDAVSKFIEEAILPRLNKHLNSEEGIATNPCNDVVSDTDAFLVSEYHKLEELFLASENSAVGGKLETVVLDLDILGDDRN